jgi:hypothetical protein
MSETTKRGPGRPRKSEKTDGNAGSGVQITTGSSDANHGDAKPTAKASGSVDAIIDRMAAAPVDVSGAGFDAPVSGPSDPGPGNTTEALSGEEPRRGPGRPRGSSNSKIKLDISGIETLLLGLHQSLAMVTNIPELGMNRDEAAQIAKAYRDAAEYYPILALDPKIAATLNLGTTVAIVYGSKILAYRMRQSMNTAPSAVQQTTPLRAMPTTPSGPINGVDTNAERPKDIPKELRTGIIPGIGAIEFPPGHDFGSGFSTTIRQ